MAISRKPSMRERESLRTRKLTPETHCRGKHAFTQAKALRQADRLVREGHAGITAYPCLFCEHWHVGHTPQR